MHACVRAASSPATLTTLTAFEFPPSTSSSVARVLHTSETNPPFPLTPDPRINLKPSVAVVPRAKSIDPPPSHTNRIRNTLNSICRPSCALRYLLLPTALQPTSPAATNQTPAMCPPIRPPITPSPIAPFLPALPSITGVTWRGWLHHRGF